MPSDQPSKPEAAGTPLPKPPTQDAADAASAAQGAAGTPPLGIGVSAPPGPFLGPPGPSLSSPHVAPAPHVVRANELRAAALRALEVLSFPPLYADVPINSLSDSELAELQFMIQMQLKHVQELLSARKVIALRAAQSAEADARRLRKQAITKKVASGDKKTISSLTKGMSKEHAQLVKLAAASGLEIENICSLTTSELKQRIKELLCTQTIR